MATPTSSKERYLLPHGGGVHTTSHQMLGDITLSQEWTESQQKSRRRSTIHSYTLSTVYHTLPKDANTLRQVRQRCK